MVLRGFLLGLIACFCFLPECAGQNVSPLEGSWLLTGGWDNPPRDGPRLTLTMGAAGEDLFGEGNYQVPGCGSHFLVQGKLAADGTFTLTSTSMSTSPSISITGTLADGGSSNWTGSYKTSFGNNCRNSSGKFVASRIESPHGTYSGELETISHKRITVSLRLTPGVFTSKVDRSVPPREVHFTPLTGKANIVGFTDMDGTELTAAEDPNNRLGGEQFIITFPLDNGYIVRIAGHIRDSKANTAQVIAGVVRDGKPTELATGMLARQ